MDKRIATGIVIVTLIILGGAVVYGNNTPTKATVEKTQGAEIQVLEKDFDFKEIKYNDGNVSHAYKIKNTGSKDLTIANMLTSCMCTQVYLKTKTAESPKFGMKGHAAESRWTGILKPGEEGEIVVIFDPTAHGPSGVGPISRFVSMETNDPENPYVEFSFNGNVVK